MDNFKLIKQKIDVKPFLEEISQYEDYWDTKRAQTVKVQRETLNIALVVGVLEEGKIIEDSHTQAKTAFYERFPYTAKWLEEIAEELRGVLSRANIISLKPEGRVYGHTDLGEYYKRRNRYHLVLQSRNGTKMVSGGEECILKEGELWWFDNKKFHEVFNLSTHPRIHIVFDLLPK